MSSWGEVYRRTAKTLEKAGFLEAEAEAKVLTAHVYGGEFSSLCLRFFDECGREKEIGELLARRLDGRPLAYVLNEKHFYGRRFYVDERVLIPRYDTESVAERALLLAQENGYRTALDLCCGSGILGVTLGAEGAFGKIVFSDISRGALDVAARNAGAWLGGPETEFIKSDFMEDISGAFDLVVCNPPYVSEADYAGLEAQVKDYEPRNALVAGNGGYAFYERAAAEIPRALNAGGALVLEIGDAQAERVCALLKEAGFDRIEWGRDLSGRPRWASGIRK